MLTQSQTYDLIVIGAGPGGYVAAARAGQLGMKVACVDRYERPGGVCLNYGCIPSKALLDSSEYAALAKSAFKEHGVGVGKPEIDLAVMMKRKEAVVTALTDNVRKLLEAKNVDLVHGTARLRSNTAVEVTPLSEDFDKQVLSGGKILLATGSQPVTLKGSEFDGETIVDSTEALALDSIPRRMVIVGGGYIGLELGSVWSRLGSKVTIVEMLPRIAGNIDGQLSRRLLRILKGQGIDFRLSSTVKNSEINEKAVRVTLESNGEQETLSCDKLLVAVGRKPLTDGLGLKNAGVETDEKGYVIVDETYRTSAENIYAIGDLIGGAMLAHKASAEGRAAVEMMAGKSAGVNYGAVPMVIYTFPETASVGMTEEEIREKEIPYCTGTFPMTGAGRARCMGETEGMVKILSHRKTDRILGVHIIAPRASDMIAEAVFAIEFGASSEDIGRIMHGHPTFSEAFQEAALMVQECSIY